MDQPVRELMGIPQINTALAPSSDTLRMQPGRYTAFFYVANPTGATMPVRTRRMRATVRIKRAPMGVFASGTLHLRVHVVGAPGGLTAATAPTSARLRNALANMNTALGAVGVRVVVDGYAEIVGAAGMQLGTIDSRAELGQLLATSTPAAGNDVLNLYVIHGIAPSSGLENAIGVAGDIVGPVGIHGTTRSGVVVAWDTTGGGGGRDLLAQVMAHECAHYLGLWHTRESRPGCTSVGQMNCSPFNGVDPIADTPTDEPTSRGYLMHWSTADGTNFRLSPGQGTVLRASVLVR
jgi:hypothetical protein